MAASEWKIELIDGYVYAFAGGTVAHDVLTLNITRMLQNAVQPPSRVFSSNMPIQRADAPTYVFPDASVSCEPVEPGTNKLLEPILAVEVSEHVFAPGGTLTLKSVAGFSLNIDRLYEGTGLPRFA